MTVHVFAGPTIARSAIARRLPGAVVHPPVRHGDLLALDPEPGDAVAIIDGVFLRTGAIRHKELMHLIQRGVAVWGASSMGALRAAELAAFGMRGVGTVFERYRSGELDADDEVAVMHSDADGGYRQMSEALVAVRVAAERAQAAGMIADEDAARIVAAARRLPFRERTYPQILRAASDDGLSEPAAAAFSAFLADGPVDVKREDAEALLDALAGSRTLGSSIAPARMPMTSFLLRWIRSAPRAAVDGERVSAMDTLTAVQLFAEDYPGLHYRVVLGELVRGELGESAVADSGDLRDWEDAAVRAAVRRGLIEAGATALPAAWAAWCTAQERDGPLRAAVARALVRSYRWAPNVRPVEPLIEAARASPVWVVAERRAAEASRLGARLFAHNPAYNPHHIADARIEQWLRDLWGVDALSFAMLDRGFGSAGDLRARAAPFLPLARTRTLERWRIGAVGLAEERAR